MGYDMPDRGIETLARGLAVHRGWVLLCQSTKRAYAYLPGGHIEFGESAAEACVREFDEEMHLADGRDGVTLGDHVLSIEQRFIQKGEPRHEISVVFHVEHLHLANAPPLRLDAVPGNSVVDEADSPPPTPQSREAKLSFVWARLDDLDRYHLLPRVLPGYIRTWARGPAAAGPEPGPPPRWLSVNELP